MSPLPCVSSLLNSLVVSFTRSYTQWLGVRASEAVSLLGYGPGVCYVSVGCLSMSEYVQGSVPPLHHTVSGSKPVGSCPKRSWYCCVMAGGYTWACCEAASRSPRFRAGGSLGFQHLPTRSVCCFLKGDKSPVLGIQWLPTASSEGCLSSTIFSSI